MARILQHKRVPVSTSAVLALVDIDGGIPTGTSSFVMNVEGGDVRWTGDAQDPTATLGVPLADGDEVAIDASPWVVKLFGTSGTPFITLTFYD